MHRKEMNTSSLFGTEPYCARPELLSDGPKEELSLLLSDVVLGSLSNLSFVQYSERVD